MRVSKDVMARNHQTILAEAVRMLRLQGIEKTSVNDVMQACGLTHGGFYRHFTSKDALVASAVQRAFHEIASHFGAISATAGPETALDAYVDQYLSPAHIKARDFGCPVAAYGAEAMREMPAVQRAMSGGINDIQTFIASGLIGDQASRIERARVILSVLVGTLVTARSTANQRDAKDILHSVRSTIAALRQTHGNANANRLSRMT